MALLLGQIYKTIVLNYFIIIMSENKFDLIVRQSNRICAQHYPLLSVADFLYFILLQFHHG